MTHLEENQMLAIAGIIIKMHNNNLHGIGHDVCMTNSVSFDTKNRALSFSIRYVKTTKIADVTVFKGSIKIAEMRIKANLILIDGISIPGKLIVTMNNIMTTHVILAHFINLNQYARRVLLEKI